jgi:site-specific recombinase XerD
MSLAGARHFVRYLRRLEVAPTPALSKYVESPYAIARYQVGPVRAHIDGFAMFLGRRGYAHETTMMYLGATRHLGHWMAARRLTVEVLTEGILAAFDRHLSCCRCPPRRRGRSSGALAGARRFLQYLRINKVACAREMAPLPAILVEFCTWMKTHRGVRESTLLNYRRYLIRFLEMAGDDPALFAPRVVRKFIIGVRAAKKAAFVALRMFIRFLVTMGRCPGGLEESVPALAEWRLASLPRYLPSQDVERIIATAPIGSRERAVLLLLARLGLRRGDIVDLALQDIDWSKGAIRVVGKSRREAWLPLPQDVGNAIIAYVRQRPPIDSDSLFALATAPVQPITPSAVSGIVYWAIHRAGIRTPSRGCHLLRHSAATRWLRDGLSMENIGVLLRHWHLETTGLYAKVDVRGLRKIAQPWPGCSP